jgi:hypothetical protein
VLPNNFFLMPLRKQWLHSFAGVCIRRYLEPGPIVLVSSAWRKKFNIMAVGWHMMLQFSPGLAGFSASV